MIRRIGTQIQVIAIPLGSSGDSDAMGTIHGSGIIYDSSCPIANRLPGSIGFTVLDMLSKTLSNMMFRRDDHG